MAFYRRKEVMPKLFCGTFDTNANMAAAIEAAEKWSHEHWATGTDNHVLIFSHPTQVHVGVKIGW